MNGDCPVNMMHSENGGSMLVHGLQCWPSIKPTLSQCSMFVVCQHEYDCVRNVF